jgi:uncharacterized protein YciI
MIQLTGVLLSVLAITSNLFMSGLRAAEPPLNKPQDQSVFSFFETLTEYQVGLVYSGPNWTAEMDEVTRQNRVYISDLVETGKLVGAGKVTGSKDLLWLLFFQNDSLQEAQAIIAAAPAVKANRFTGEVRQTWGTKGVGSKIAEGGKVEAMTRGPKTTHFLALFKKGSKWSPEENDDSRKLVQNHMTYHWKLHEAGVLRFWGAFEGPGDIRGVAILQANSLEAAKELLKDDPALKVNWVKQEYYVFEVAEGLLP